MRTSILILAASFLTATAVVAVLRIGETPWYENVRPIPKPVIEQLTLDWNDESFQDYADCNFTAPLERDDALLILLHTDQFATESVGDGGVISPQVLALQRILDDAQAKGAFEKLLVDSNNAGKLYALCGLYLVDHDSYGECRNAAILDGENISTLSGCILSEDLIATVLNDIDNGTWPNRFKKAAAR